jgi:acetoin:2,6-dichlorophenolindophenol oxidoreductase subunit beta
MKATFDQVILDAIAEEMARDESVLYLATNPPQAFTDQFGTLRVRRTPIAESAMMGMSVGAAASGYRPVVGLANVTFSFSAGDPILNQAGKIRYMSGAQRAFPLVFYASFFNGGRMAAQHSQTGFAVFAQAAGLKIVAPSSAADAKGLMKAAIRDNNPVAFIYSDRLGSTEEEVPDDDHVIPLGVAHTIRPGSDITIVGICHMARIAEQAADKLAHDGISAEVIDPRSLVPLDMATIRQSVRRTGRLIIVDESFPTCSFASEIAAAICEDSESLRALAAPVRRLCTAPVPVPFSPPLEDYVLPGVNDVVSAARQLVASSERAASLG